MFNPTLKELACCLEKLKAKVNSSSTPANATLVAGTVAVADARVTTGSFVTYNVATVGGTPGTISYVATAGVITFTSSSGTDTSTITYTIHY